MRNRAIQKAAITGWIDKQGAREVLETYIKTRLYKRGDISLGSCKFKNGIDKSAGYETRIIVTSGIHPELEQCLIKPRRSRVAARKSPLKKVTRKKVTKNKPVRKVTDNKDHTSPVTPRKTRRKKCGLSILDTVTVNDHSYLIEDGMYNRTLDKIYLYLTSETDRCIGVYDLKDTVSQYRHLDTEEEQAFCDWTRFCDSVAHPREMA